MRFLGLILLVLAGAASGLALPPVGAWWVLGLSFPVLLWWCEKARNWRSGFAGGLLFGLGYFCVAFHWIGFAFLVDADAYLWMMPFAVGGLALMMASYWGIAVALAVRLPLAFVPRFISIPVFLSGAEWLRGHLFTGFPWAAPGLVAEGMGAVLQAASLIGMTGLTLMVLLWASLPFALWRSRHQGFAIKLLLAVLAALLPVAQFWGVARLESHAVAFKPDITLRLVQPNVSQSDKWRSENAVVMLDDLVALSSSPVATPQVIVWPEASVPFLLDEEPEALRRIGEALVPGQSLLAGSIRRGADAGEATPYYTSIIGIDDEGRVTGRYDKWRLVPGGEFLPLEWLLAPLGFRKVVDLPESLSPGPGPQNLLVPRVGLAGALICYEAIFPHRLLADERPDFLVNVTNDGWFGQSVGPYQHLAQVRLRAIEQGLPVVRAANTGISAVFDSLGRSVIRTELGVRTAVDSPLPMSIAATAYAKWGDWSLLFIALLVIFLGAAAQRSHHAAARP